MAKNIYNQGVIISGSAKISGNSQIIGKMCSPSENVNTLVDEICELRKELEQHNSVAAVDSARALNEAEVALNRGEESRFQEALRKAGSCALDFARDLSLKLAENALSRAIGC